jgi:hypothetical protein
MITAVCTEKGGGFLTMLHGQRASFGAKPKKSWVPS